MALTTVAELRSALGVGTLYTDATLQEVCDATDAVLLPMLWANTNFAVAHSNVGTIGTLYFDLNITDQFYIGQSINVEGAGAKFNGNKTVTSVSDRSITVTTSHLSDTPKHPINPYALVKSETYQDWADDKAVQQAALQISVDIWQARQTTSSGGVAVDFQPGPWKMSSSLLARIRGLIAHALDPRSMVG
jgi:hypothetical protein